MVDHIYRTRSLGVAAEGLPDQYADGKAAKVWEYYIGCTQTRKSKYREWITGVLRERGCKTVLDVACGTGVDSVLLLEEGFRVVSTDASDKMLKKALKERWRRRKEPAFDQWVIEEANWLSVEAELEGVEGIPKEGFDAVICLGNSFAHLPDFEGNQHDHKVALANFWSMVKPGGILMIDHRNYDDILDTGTVPARNIYYSSDHVVDVKCSNLYVNGQPSMTTLDYVMDMTILGQSSPDNGNSNKDKVSGKHHFRLSYYPHRLEQFGNLLKEVFGGSANHIVYADFSPIDEVQNPAYYIHSIQK